MATNNLGLVSLRGLYHEDAQYTFLLASGITQADVGKAVTLDLTAANTVKLAADNDRILGRLHSVEGRTQEGPIARTGAVGLAGGYDFLVNPQATASSPDETPAIGDYIVGGTATAGNGYVQKEQTGGKSDWLVVEVLDSGARVVAIKV